jgi:hypothetical protein
MDGRIRAGQAFLESRPSLLERALGVSVSSSASRSKAMKLAGVSCDSSLTRLAAGWMRCCSTSNSSRSPITTMISPSMTHFSGRFAWTASTISGK